MRLLFSVFCLTLCVLRPVWAVTGDDSAPGQSCSPNKAVRVTANPSGVGAYILTCESGKWVATLTAAMPTLPDQVATKRYIDEHVASIETNIYSQPRVWTTTGEERQILITALASIWRGSVASAICSMLSNGVYVHGKFTTLRYIPTGLTQDPLDGVNYPCEGDCLNGSSGKKYAWYDHSDFIHNDFYLNLSTPIYLPRNAGEVGTNLCGVYEAGSRGTIAVNGECMAGATTTRPAISGKRNSPSYTGSSYVVEELTCWAN